MKELFDHIWNMPASEFLKWLGIIVGSLIGLWLLWVLYITRRFNKARKDMRVRHETFKNKHGLG